MEEIPSFREDVARIYRQMLLCQKRKRLTKDEGGDYSRNAEECFLHEKICGSAFEESDEENNDMNPIGKMHSRNRTGG